MSNPVDDKPDGARDGDARQPYHQFQYEIYQTAMLMGRRPPVTTDPNKLEHDARQAMQERPTAFNYVFGGAGEGATMQDNRLAFRRWKLVPRFLRPTVPRDLSVNLFGQTYGTGIVYFPCV